MSLHWSEEEYRAHQARQRDVQRGREGQMAEGRPVSEKVFLDAIGRIARDAGWLFYHTYSAKKSAPGYFDCTLAKAGQPLVLAELKTATGTLTLEQQRWYETAQQVTGVESYIWRPEDMALIVEKLLIK